MSQISWRLEWAALSASVLVLTSPVKNCQRHFTMRPNLFETTGQEILQILVPHQTIEFHQQSKLLLSLLASGLADASLAFFIFPIIQYMWKASLSNKPSTTKVLGSEVKNI